MGMFSEALKILDQNTVKYMIEELRKKLEKKDAVIAAAARAKDVAIKEKDAEINALKKQLEHYKQSE